MEKIFVLAEYRKYDYDDARKQKKKNTVNLKGQLVWSCPLLYSLIRTYRDTLCS